MATLWEITVPLSDNAGKPYDHSAWRRDLLDIWGGFTGHHVQGLWRDPVTGQTFDDNSVAYRILCDEEPALVSLAAGHFPDQLAWCFCQVGTGEIVPAAPRNYQEAVSRRMWRSAFRGR